MDDISSPPSPSIPTLVVYVGVCVCAVLEFYVYCSMLLYYGSHTVALDTLLNWILSREV